MDTSGQFNVDFRELSGGEFTWTWELDDMFFSALDEQDIEHGQLTATLRVNKKASGFLLSIRVNGTVEVPCDRCLELMTQPISGEEQIEVCLGDSFEDDGERITIPEYEPVLDVAWNIYETIALAVPISHVHPEGSCEEDFSQYLVTDDEPEGHHGEDDASIDSRWNALRALFEKSEK